MRIMTGSERKRERDGVDVNRRVVGSVMRCVATWVRHETNGGWKRRRSPLRQVLGARMIFRDSTYGVEQKGRRQVLVVALISYSNIATGNYANHVWWL